MLFKSSRYERTTGMYFQFHADLDSFEWCRLRWWTSRINIQRRDQSPLEETDDDDLHVFKRFDDLTAVKWTRSDFVKFKVFRLNSSPSHVTRLTSACIPSAALWKLMLLFYRLHGRRWRSAVAVRERERISQDFRAVIVTDEQPLALQITFPLLSISHPPPALSQELWK